MDPGSSYRDRPSPTVANPCGPPVTRITSPNGEPVEETLTVKLEPNLDDLLDGQQWCEPCPRCRPQFDFVPVNGLPFAVLNDGSLSEAIELFRSCGTSHVVHFLAAHPTVVARENATYRKLLNSGDLLVSDGAPVSFVLRVRRRAARRIMSTSAFGMICSQGISSGLRHFFIGGANDSVAVALEAAIRREYTGIDLRGFTVPPFRSYTDQEVQDLADQIIDTQADVVWVGLGAPKQDILAHRLRMRAAAPIIICVGATFDFVAGTKTRAPRILQIFGLEWAYRLYQEPSRLWRRYLLGNTMFLGSLIKEQLLVTRRPGGPLPHTTNTSEAS